MVIMASMIIMIIMIMMMMTDDIIIIIIITITVIIVIIAIIVIMIIIKFKSLIMILVPGTVVLVVVVEICFVFCISTSEVHSQEELGSWAPTVRGRRPKLLDLKASLPAGSLCIIWVYGFWVVEFLDEVLRRATGLCHGAMQLQIILVVFNLLVGAVRQSNFVVVVQRPARAMVSSCKS